MGQAVLQGWEERVVAIWDRILLFVFSLLVFVSSACTLLSFVVPEDSIQFITTANVIGVSSVLFLISIRFLFYGIRRNRQSRQQPSIVSRTDIGEVRISLETIESLVVRAVRTVRGMNEVKTRILTTDSGIRIAVRVTVDHDIPIPASSQQVQEKVKNYVTAIAGVQVDDVIVSVQDLRKVQSGKTRDLS